jgi:glutathione synthase/RimK-type ligase-like ATP-grasp enzyme
MALHLIVVDREDDWKWPGPDRVVVTAKDFAANGAAKRFPPSSRVINFCRDYGYLALGYYASLLAEARGQRVIPPVEALLDLNWKRIYQADLPEINDLVRKSFTPAPGDPLAFTVHLFFGAPDDARFREVARRIFDRFRCPILAIDLRHRKEGLEVVAIRPLSVRDLAPIQEPLFAQALDRYTRVSWRRSRAVHPAVYYIAILHNPAELIPPSNERALKKFIRLGESLGVELELITRKDYNRLPEFDALFIRETTDLDDHTYRFAKKAEAEGMPVIDSPQSILKCANKIYLAELMAANGVPTPKTLAIDQRQLSRLETELGYPVVLKIPDGAFSRGVHKAENREQLKAIADRLFEESDLILAQEFVQTEFDWRVGVLNRKPIFVCQYFMAKGHWQVVKYAEPGGDKYIEGGDRTLAVDDAPAHVVALGTKAASLIGDGLYGVDIKETPRGPVVMEVNDNPNVDAGIEDAVLKDELYKLIVRDFIRRIEERTATLPQSARESARGLSAVTAASNGAASALFQGSPGPDGGKDESPAANANGRVLSSG